MLGLDKVLKVHFRKCHSEQFGQSTLALRNRQLMKQLNDMHICKWAMNKYNVGPNLIMANHLIER